MKNIKQILLFFVLLIPCTLHAQEKNKPLIYQINIKENIGSNTWVYLQNGLREAKSKHADAVLIHLNTYGGGVVEADSMRTAILDASLPVYVFVDNNAASAGALISIACDSIFMRKSASIGAATVVSGADGAKAPDKYQSYMRAMMRATAESHGGDTIIQNGETVVHWKRDPLIAEAMVDERVVVPGYADSTQILTLTARQAIELSFCDGIADNVNEVISRHLGYQTYELQTYNPTFYDKLKGFLTNGIVQAFLIMFIIGGIYMELQTPGVGFPSAIALTAAILYFTPLYLTGYMQNWEVILFVLGLIFIVFEIFVVPGFGFTGIVGIVLIVCGLIFALVSYVDFSMDEISLPINELYRAILVVFSGLSLGFFAILYLTSRIGKPGVFQRVALQSDQEGYVSVSMSPASLVGAVGIASTVLRPSGKVKIDGEYYDAVSIKGFIDAGEEVVVKRYENFQLYVVKK